MTVRTQISVTTTATKQINDIWVLNRDKVTVVTFFARTPLSSRDHTFLCDYNCNEAIIKNNGIWRKIHHNREESQTFSQRVHIKRKLKAHNRNPGRPAIAIYTRTKYTSIIEEHNPQLA